MVNLIAYVERDDWMILICFDFCLQSCLYIATIKFLLLSCFMWGNLSKSSVMQCRTCKCGKDECDTHMGNLGTRTHSLVKVQAGFFDDSPPMIHEMAIPQWGHWIKKKGRARAGSPPRGEIPECHAFDALVHTLYGITMFLPRVKWK